MEYQLCTTVSVLSVAAVKQTVPAAFNLFHGNFHLRNVRGDVFPAPLAHAWLWGSQDQRLIHPLSPLSLNLPSSVSSTVLAYIATPGGWLKTGLFQRIWLLPDVWSCEPRTLISDYAPVTLEAQRQSGWQQNCPNMPHWNFCTQYSFPI